MANEVKLFLAQTKDSLKYKIKETNSWRLLKKKWGMAFQA